MSAVVASCPGKVLITGGYAVLERPNKGLVLGTTARFHTSISEEHGGKLDELVIVVESPQYQQIVSVTVILKPDGTLVCKKTSEDSNSYVEKTIGYGVAAALCLERKRNSPESLDSLLDNHDSFEHVLKLIDCHFTVGAFSFGIGNVENKANENQNSFKVLVAAKFLGLNSDATVKLWGQHYHHVIADPTGSSHGNLRQFLKYGWEVVRLPPLLDVLLDISPAAEAFVAKTPLTKVNILDRTLRVRLEADNDFYSQQDRLLERGLPYTTESLRGLAPFIPCVDDQGTVVVSKTGLGSSAAMVSSLIAALIRILCPSLHSSHAAVCIGYIHAVAQLTHSIIQGKIGSGFDVCAALFGSMQYVRYDESTLQDILEFCASGNIPSDDMLWNCYLDLNYISKPFSLPPKLKLMCGDVRGGSETPSMSRDILKWRVSGDQIHLWNDLILNNDKIASTFSSLNQFAIENETHYNETLRRCSQMDCNDWSINDPIVTLLLKMRKEFHDIRNGLRHIGELAGVPVEPACQQILCDGTMKQPGVLICGVPGAGGFDAIFAIVIEDAQRNVEKYWTQSNICALLLSESSDGLSIEFK